MPTLDINTIRHLLEAQEPLRAGEAAVLIPLVGDEDDWEVLLEVRAAHLAVQPNEVCLPGGAVEDEETPEQAAVRETTEELLVDEGQIELIGKLGTFEGPGGRALHAFVGRLLGYDGTFSADEVAATLTVPLSRLVEQDPATFSVTLEQSFPDDFPFDRIPGGRAYPWRLRKHEVCFYLDTEPLVWGVTARVLRRLSQVLRGGDPA